MARAASRDIVVLGSRRKARLEAIVRRPSSSQALVRRARIVLLAFRDWPNEQIARELGCAVNTVRTWRHRFVRGGMPALCDRPRSGRPGSYGPDVRLRIVAAATSVPPEGSSVWTHALIAGQLADTGISVSQAGRILADLDLRPHKVRGWLNRRDNEQFWAQAAAVCDACLRPPPDTVAGPVVHDQVNLQARIDALVQPVQKADEGDRVVAGDRLGDHLPGGDVKRGDHRDGAVATSGATRAWIAAHPRISVTYTPKHASWWWSASTRRPGSRPSTASIPSGGPGAAAWPAGSSSTWPWHHLEQLIEDVHVRELAFGSGYILTGRSSRSRRPGSRAVPVRGRIAGQPG